MSSTPALQPATVPARATRGALRLHEVRQRHLHIGQSGLAGRTLGRGFGHFNAEGSATAGASDYVGYTIIAVKTVDSFRDKGGEAKDGFEGCDYDRVIVFTDGTAVRCRGYGYKYAYRPKAVILGQQVNFQGHAVTMLKMIVQGTAYDVTGR